MASTAYIKCPHCGSRMRTQGHKTISPLYKKLVATCQNPDCLFSASVDIDIARQIQPSLCPKPEIQAQLKK